MSRQSKRGSRQGRRGYGPSGFEEAGGYMSAKIAKLENQYQTSLTTSNHEKQRGIFSGVAIFVNGYTEPTAEELKRIMMVNGGIYHHYYSRSKTTHIIANNLPNTKVKNMNTDNIVSPKWITDSLQAGHLLDYSKYILYNNQSLSQPKLGFKPLESSRKETVTNPPVMDKSLGKEEDSNSDPSQDSEDTPCLSSSDQSRSSVSSGTLCKTPVEHNAIESGKLSLKSLRTDVGLSPSKVHSMNTSNPGFLSEFYNNSRLHHISTMGAVFKQYVTEMQMKNTDFVGRQKLMDWAKSKSPLAESSKMPLKTTSRKMKRIVMHIDMDCFFVSVGLRKHPELRGKPIAVTHARANVRPEARKGMDRQYELNYYRERANKRLQSAAMKVGKSHNLGSTEDVDFQDDENGELTSDSRNTGTLPVTDKFSSIPLIDDNSSMSEIASCSYEAREAGVKNGMFLGAALKLCPHLQTIPYDFEGYKEVSYKLYDIVADFTHDIEAVSCDEMFVDLTDVLRSCQVTPHEFASYLREQVQNATGCPCSAGMGPNMLVARMATRIAKPNGQHMAEPEDLALYMKDQKVTGLPGVGWSLSKRLESEGIITCDDLQRKSLGHLQSVFGTKTGQSLYNYCRGIDERPVKSEHQRKSVSAEVNYGIRFTCKADAEKFLNELSSEVENRLNSVSLKGKCITLKLKIRAKDAPVETAKFMGHGVCDNIAKSVTLGVATSSASVIEREAVSLLRQVKAPPQDLRGVGIQVSRLEGHLGPSGSSSSGSCSIKSFLLSAKASSKKPSHSDHSSRKEVAEESHSGKTGQLSKIFESKETESIDRTPAFQEIAEEPQPGPSRVADPQGDPGGIPFQRDKHTSSVKETIDVEVLMALPSELREQVVLEYQQQGYKMPHVGDIEMSPQPSTSRGKAQDMKMQKNKVDRKMVKPSDVSTDIPVSSRTEELYIMDRNTRDNRGSSAAESSRINEDEEDMHITSFSQVDSSFLDAIPADLREELRKDFEYKKNTAVAGLHAHSSSNQSKNLVPQQNRRSSPQKHSKSSGGGQSKRGRLSKTSKRRAVNEGLTTLTSLMSAQQLPKTFSPSKRMDMSTPSSVDDDQRKAGQTASKEPANSSKADPSSPASDSGSGSSSRESSGSCKREEDRETIPNLCGVEELVNVKALIREWVSSCPQPELEDADILASYYTSLILHHDLERLDILIRFLHRQVLRTENKHWVSAYKSVIGRVQSVMLENYQAKLKVKIL